MQIKLILKHSLSIGLFFKVAEIASSFNINRLSITIRLPNRISYLDKHIKICLANNCHPNVFFIFQKLVNILTFLMNIILTAVITDLPSHYG